MYYKICVTFEINTLATSICVRGCGKVALDVVRVRKPLPGLGKGVTIWFGKVWLIGNYKYCHSVMYFTRHSNS